MDRKVEVGTRWKHFKGNIITVIAIAKNTENLEELVIYDHDGDIWARPLSMFLSEVDHLKYKDIEQKYRFEKIED